MRMQFIRQKDAMQCGVAALAMISRCFGARYDIDYLSQYCFPTNQGVSLKGISDAAKQIGLKPTAAYFTIDNLREFSLPCILHWNQNHFVVLYKISRKSDKFFIADPAKGKYICTLAEFMSHWISTERNGEKCGIGMSFEKGDSFDVDCRNYRGKDTHSMNFLWHYLSRYKKQLSLIGLCLLVGCVLQLIMPFLTQWIVDKGIKDKDIGFIWLVLLGELMIVVGRTVAGFIRRWITLHVSMRINISLVSDFFIKLFKLPMSFFDTKLMGDLLQRISDHSRVQNFLTGQIVNVIFTTLCFFIFGVVLLTYSSLIFGVFVAGSIIYGLWLTAFLRRRKVLDYEMFERQAVNQNKTYQLVTSMQEIKLQDCEERRRREWEAVQADLFEVQMKSLKLTQTQEAGSIFINEVKNIVITVLSATAVISGQMTLGGMLAVQYIIGQLNSPVEQLMAFIYSIQDVKISLERINEIHNRDNEAALHGQADAYAAEKSIQLRDVSFKYDRHATDNTLTGISFDIPAGKVTAIVGASGSGKTTLIKLMLGYYPVISGAISIAGRNLNEYNLKWWRRQCGVVMQDGVIFSESIARNIAVDDGDIEVDRLENAARIANIHDYITSLPLKYDTMIGRDGAGISQGQRQRILIARAVYKNPDFIFLDEATNALDAKNERAIVENLVDFYKGRTAVVVAHRLSTVRNADNIIVLDNGKVVETGTHASLIAGKGTYYNLVKNQLELGS